MTDAASTGRNPPQRDPDDPTSGVGCGNVDREERDYPRACRPPPSRIYLCEDNDVDLIRQSLPGLSRPSRIELARRLVLLQLVANSLAESEMPERS